MTPRLPILLLLLLAGCSTPTFTASLKQAEAALSATPVTGLVTTNQVQQMKQAVLLTPVVAAVKKTGKPAASRLPFTMSITKLYTPAMKGKTCVLLASSDLKTWNTLFAFPYSANPTNIITLPFQGRQFYKMEAM